MKTCTAIAATLVAASAFGEREWKSGDYTPADWQPSISNVIFGITHYNDPSDLTYYSYDADATLYNNTVVLSDGAVPGATIDYQGIVALNGGGLKWNFPAATHLDEVRFFSRWRDGGRDGMYIKSVRVKYEGSNDWVSIAGDDAIGGTPRGDVGRKDSNPSDSNNSSSGALYLILRDNAGGHLVPEKVHALYVEFSGAQDNNGTGYVEIEACVPSEWTRGSLGLVEYLGLGVAENDGGTSFTVTHPAEFRALEPVLLTTSGGSIQLDQGEVYRISVAPGNEMTVTAVGLSDMGAIMSVNGELAGAVARVKVFPTDDESGTAVSLEYWSADDPGRVSTISFGNRAAGEYDLRIDDLKPNREYFVRLVAAPASGGETASYSPFAFSTGVSSAWLPGLWQVRDYRGSNPGGWTTDTDVMAVSVGTGIDARSRVSGTVMAYVRNEFTDPISGLEYTWRGLDYLAFLYEGYMYFKAGKYDFISAIDDTAYLAIGGTDVHVCNAYTNGKRSSWTCPADGWYKVKILIGDYTLDAGPINDSTAFHYSTDNGAYWRKFIDSGKGDLLHVGGATTSTRYWGDRTSFGIELSVEDLPEEFSVYLCTGAADAGFDSPDDWDAKVQVASGQYSAQGGKVTVDSRSLGSGEHYAKLLVDWGAGRAWSDTVTPGAAGELRLSPVVEADFSAAVSATFRGNIVTSGGEGKASVKILLSESSDMSGAVEHSAGSFAAGEAFEFTVNGLAAGSDYYWRVVAVNAAGTLTDTTPVQKSTTPSAPSMSDVTATATNWNATFGVEIDEVGPGGSSTLTLFTGADAYSLTNTASRTITETGGKVFSVEFPFVNEKVYYKFVIDNSSPVGTYSIASEVASVDLVCTYNYYWKVGVTEGEWENPENWTNQDGNPLDPRCRYPNSKKSQVRFDRASDDPITITVSGKYDIYGFRSENAKDVTIVGGGTNVTQITADKVNDNDTTRFVANMKFTIDNLYYYTRGRYEPTAGSVLTLRNAARMRLAEKGIMTIGNGAEVVVSGGSVLEIYEHEIEHTTSATWKMTIDDSEVYGDVRAQFSRNASCGTTVFEFKGDRPFFTVYNISVGWDSGSAPPSSFIFHVPRDGYASAPVRSSAVRGRNPDRALIDWGNQSVYFSVADDSPVFKSPGGKDVQLLEWPADKGIYTDHISGDKTGNSEARARRLSYYFTYDGTTAKTGTTATGFWVHVAPPPGLAIFVR